MLKPQTIIICERNFPPTFYPFTIMHPLWDLRSGALRHFEKIAKHFPSAQLLFYGRSLQLAAFIAQENLKDRDRTIPQDHNILLLTGNVVPTTETFKTLSREYEQALAQQDNAVAIFLSYNLPVAAYIPAARLHPHADTIELDNIVNLAHPIFKNAIRIPTAALCIHYLWDIFSVLERSLIDDFQWFPSGVSNEWRNRKDVVLIEPEAISIGENVQIGAFTVLDASSGPIIIDNDATIMPQCYIKGPAYIGPKCLLKPGTKLLGTVILGEYCKVAGEIEESVIHSFSNKQHDGFLGHSYLCSWVNFGAGTTVSNLKNNYSIITVQLRNTRFVTHRMFLGVLCGDHTKTSINTRLNTGSIIGISCNIFANDFPAKYIPSFTWGGGEHSSLYRITQALATARTVKQRRNKQLLPEEEILFRREYERIVKSISKDTFLI